MGMDTSNKSLTIKDIPRYLAQILSAIVRPIFCDPVNNAIRSVLVSGTVTTVSIVTTLNQLGGVAIRDALLVQTERNTWANSVRSRIN